MTWRVLCDRCGFEIDSDEARHEWTGLIVCGECWEPRHPQDFVKGVRDHQNVPFSRPEPPDTFVERYPFTNSEARTVVVAMSVPPNAERKAAIDTLVGALKTAGVWDKLDFLHVYYAHTEQAALLNWKVPGTYDGTNNGATFAADGGFTGDGSSAYIGTGFTPSTAAGSMEQNSAHVGCWMRTPVGADEPPFGGGTDPYIYLYPLDATQTLSAINDGADALIDASQALLGHLVLNRSGAAAQQLYVGGLSVGTGTNASTGLANGEIEALRFEDDNAYAGQQIAVLHAGASLSAGEVSALHSALSAFMA